MNWTDPMQAPPEFNPMRFPPCRCKRCVQPPGDEAETAETAEPAEADPAARQPAPVDPRPCYVRCPMLACGRLHELGPGMAE
ncbi:hypothetical protein [Streptomyces sp. BV333]|uniref:hypothetical protein n=1 Tax=Streptomyces sp. BV333 TaxID=2849673 RepID=UPI0027E079AF|nr:hypothetical protein [Streptomyces sp. BV333]